MVGLVKDSAAAAGKQFVARSPLSRGLTKGKTTAAFRTRFKDAILAVNARGFGEALIATGNPIAGWVPAPDDGDLPGWGALY